MAGNVRVKSIKIELNNSAISRIKQRSRSELQTWARSVLVNRITPVTPVDTGRLRRETDISVTGGDRTEVWWYWRAPYAGVVEDAWGGRGTPRTPGTIAPFAEPTIRQSVQDEIALPIGRAFGGS